MRYKFSEEDIQKIAEEYLLGSVSAKVIQQKYGISPRHFYKITKEYGRKGHSVGVKRRNLRISYEEAEMLLFMILECESLVKNRKNDLAIMKNLQNRILAIVDEFEELDKLKEL